MSAGALDAERPPHARSGLRVQPVRVMHVLYRLQDGGMEHGVIKLVNGLDRSHVASSICSTTPATDVKRLVRPDVPLLECHRREGNDPSLVLQLYRLFRRERPHVVHTHAWGTLCEGLVAARLARVPRVVHGEHGTLQLRSYQARVQKAAWKRVDRLLSVSSRLAERMSVATGFPQDRIQVIRNGVDLSRFGSIDKTEARRALSIRPDTFVVGTVGRLVSVKDHESLLRACARLAGRGCEFEAVIAGEGPLRVQLEQQAAALGIGSRVRFLGLRPDVEQVFAALDVFVLSSSSEGLSNTILEAMASGVAVVATRVGGADELVEEGVTGLLVPAQSPDTIAEAVESLAREPSRRVLMAAAGQRRAATQFALDGMLRAYDTLYASLNCLPDYGKTTLGEPAR